MYWQIYLSEPRLDKRHDWQAAQVVQAIYQFMSSFGKGRRKIKINDCLLKFNEQKKIQTPEDMANILRLRFGKKFKKAEKVIND